MSDKGRSLLHFLILGTASAGFISYLPYRVVPFVKWKGGGLLGSLAGWALLWACPAQGVPFWGLALLLSVVSVATSHYAEKILNSHDDPRIVIDEVLGVWIAGIGIPRSLWPMAAALVFFRLFDVFKGPWGHWAARAPGGWGVVADDVLAGIIANFCVRAALPFLS
ncbi:MAG: phosphatidylglycerophosphatase A [Elusimicrobia bacterium]|nr:phosphatidylglycerophosphatase A [Elusimicrobiota bacterium]